MGLVNAKITFEPEKVIDAKSMPAISDTRIRVARAIKVAVFSDSSFIDKFESSNEFFAN